MSHIAPNLRNYLDAFIDILFPASCIACNGALEIGENHICTICNINLPRTNFHLSSRSNPVMEKFWGRVKLSHAFSYLYFRKYTSVQRLMHQFKYNDAPFIGELLASWYAAELQASDLDKEFDILIPVPLHPQKLKIRGYNQSEYIGKGLAKVWDIPLLPQGLSKTIHTESQTKKSRTERIQNLKDGFSLPDPKAIKNARILLIDDVITTGATLETCANTLLAHGAQQVSIATLAVAQN